MPCSLLRVITLCLLCVSSWQRVPSWHHGPATAPACHHGSWFACLLDSCHGSALLNDEHKGAGREKGCRQRIVWQRPGVSDEDEKAHSVVSSEQGDGDEGDDNFVSDEDEEGDEDGGEAGEDSDQDRDARILKEGLAYLDNKLLAMSRKAALSWVNTFSSVVCAFDKVACAAPPDPQPRRASWQFLQHCTCALCAFILALQLQKVHLPHGHQHERQMGGLG